MTALDLLAAIGGTKSLSALDRYCRAVWRDWGAGRLSDDQAQSSPRRSKRAGARCGGPTR